MKLNSKRTFIIGLAFFSICAFWQMYDNIVPLILKYRYGISDGISGPIMALDNVLALFMLPLFGMLSDKKGVRMPFPSQRHFQCSLRCLRCCWYP